MLRNGITEVPEPPSWLPKDSQRGYPGKERWGVPELGVILPTLVIKMSRTNQDDGGFSLFSQAGSFFFPSFLKQPSRSLHDQALWPVGPDWAMSLSFPTNTDTYSHTPAVTGEAWKAKGPCPQDCCFSDALGKRKLPPTHPGLNTMSSSPWRKLRHIVGKGRPDWVLQEQACPFLRPLMTSGGSRAICQKPTVTSETLLMSPPKKT